MMAQDSASGGSSPLSAANVERGGGGAPAAGKGAGLGGDVANSSNPKVATDGTAGIGGTAGAVGTPNSRGTFGLEKRAGDPPASGGRVGAGFVGLGGTDGSGGNPGTVLVPAPAVRTSTPANQATGVRSDAKLQIVFSEPMAPESVEKAYYSSDLPAVAVAFAWSENNTVLELTPKTPLVYADATADATVAAKRYGFLIDTSAKSAQGAALKESIRVEYSTLRRVTEEVEWVDTKGFDVGFDSIGQGCIPSNSFRIGGIPTIYNQGLFVKFDIPSLSEIESATLDFGKGTQSSISLTIPLMVSQHLIDQMPTSYSSSAGTEKFLKNYSEVTRTIELPWFKITNPQLPLILELRVPTVYHTSSLAYDYGLAIICDSMRLVLTGLNP